MATLLSSLTSDPEEIINETTGIPLWISGKSSMYPETSAAGPFREADGSRPIQCFQCHGWGHPKRLCPSHLNYTWGGVAWDNPSQMTDRRLDSPPPQNPSPQQ